MQCRPPDRPLDNARPSAALQTTTDDRRQRAKQYCNNTIRCAVVCIYDSWACCFKRTIDHRTCRRRIHISLYCRLSASRYITTEADAVVSTRRRRISLQRQVRVHCRLLHRPHALTSDRCCVHCASRRCPVDKCTRQCYVTSARSIDVCTYVHGIVEHASKTHCTAGAAAAACWCPVDVVSAACERSNLWATRRPKAQLRPRRCAHVVHYLARSH